MQKHEATSVRLGARDSEVQAIFATSLCAMDVRFAEGEAWGGRFSGVVLPDISVYKDEGVGTRNYVRSVRHIRQAPLDEYLYVLQLRAGSIVFQGGTQTVRMPGTATLMTPSRPFSGHISSESYTGNFSGLVAKIAGPVFRKRVPNIDLYVDHPMVLSAVSNNVSRFLLETSLTEAANLSDGESRYLGQTLVDAIANATLEAIEKAGPQQHLYSSSLARVHQEAQDFIAANLSNTQLNIAAIARHCGVSERYLHKAFSTYSGPVGEYIREARLLACQRELLDPRFCNKAIRDIAMDHGFGNLAYFSRAYRVRFSTSPSQHRNTGSR